MEPTLKNVPPLERDLFQRILIDRVPYALVARDQGVTTETVRTRVYRLRKRLLSAHERHRERGRDEEERRSPRDGTASEAALRG